MSDNPNSEELAKLGFELDENSVQEVVSGFDKIDSAARAEMEIFGLINEQVDENSKSFANMFEAIKGGADDASQSLAAIKAQLDDVNSSIAQAKQTGYTPGLTQPSDIGYGNSGGLIGPEEAPDDGSGGGGGGGGSLFAAGHGLRAASGLASIAGVPGAAPAITGVADLAYLTKGLQAMSAVLSSTNDAIEASIASTGELGAAFIALDIPMAGLLVVGLPVAAAIAAMAVAIAGFIDILKKGVDAVQEAAKQLSDYNQDVENLTKAEVQQKLAAAQDEATGYQNTINTIRDKGAKLALDEESTSDPVKKIAEIAGLKALSDQLDVAQKGLDGANDSINKYNSELGSQQVINDSASATIRAQTDAMIKQQAQFAKDDEMSSTSAQKHRDEVAADAVSQASAIATLQESNAAQGISKQETLKNNDAIAAHQQTLADDTAELEHLNTVSIPHIAALEAEAAITKEVTTDINDINKAAQAYGKAVISAQDTLTNSTIDAKTKELGAEEQYTQGSLQDTEQRLKIAEAESQQETAIKLAAYQASVDLGTKLSENEAKANEDFGRQQADDQTKYNQGRAKMVRDEADTEQTDLAAHLQKLADIQNQSHNNDQQALLDRNFLQLAKNKESSTQAVDAENERYTQQEASLRSHLSQQERDQDIAEQQTEQQQRVALARKIDDLQTGYDQALLQQQTAERRKIEAARDAETTKQQDLTQSENYQIQLLRQGLQTELDLYRTQEQQRIAIAQQTQDTIIVNASNSLKQLGQAGAPYAGTAAGVNAFANGGSFGAGQPFVMGEGGKPENLNFGAGGSQINGAALVYPLQSGSVTQAGGGKSYSFNPVFNISGNQNEEQVAQYAVGKMQQMFNELVGLSS